MSKKKKDEQYTTKSMYEPVTGMVNDSSIPYKSHAETQRAQRDQKKN